MSYPEARYRGDTGEVSAIYRPADQEPELTQSVRAQRDALS